MVHPLSLIAGGVTSQPDGDNAVAHCPWADRYPHLWEVLTCTNVDGTPRQPGALMIFFDDGRVTLRITEPLQQLVCFFTDLTVDTALDGLNVALGAGKGDWRPDKRGRARRA